MLGKKHLSEYRLFDETLYLHQIDTHRHFKKLFKEFLASTYKNIYLSVSDLFHST